MRLRCKLPTLHCTADSQGRSGRECMHYAPSLSSAASTVQQKSHPSTDWWFTLRFPWLTWEVLLSLGQSLSPLANVSLLFTTAFPFTGVLIGMNEGSYEGNSQWNGKPWNSVFGHPGFTSFPSWLALAHLNNANDLFLGCPS